MGREGEKRRGRKDGEEGIKGEVPPPNIGALDQPVVNYRTDCTLINICIHYHAVSTAAGATAAAARTANLASLVADQRTVKQFHIQRRDDGVWLLHTDSPEPDYIHNRDFADKIWVSSPIF